MKRVVLALLAVAALASCTPKRCEIIGRLGDPAIEGGKVYLLDNWSGDKTIDSVDVVDGVYHFKRVEHEPTFAQLVHTSGRPISYLFIEPGKIRIMDDHETDTSKAVGTPANEAFNELMEANRTLVSSYREAIREGKAEEAAKIEQEYDALQESYFAENKDNVFGLFMLHQLGYSKSSAEMLLLIEELSEDMKALTADLRQNIERRMRTEPQAEGSDYVPYFIDIEQPNLAGEMVSLRSVVENKKNRYVLLDFWASWCGPCMGEMPVLKEAYKLYHKKGFEIYGVSLDAKRESWQGAIEKLGLKWVNVSTLEQFNNTAVDEYAVESIPTNFLIDCSNGVIIAKNLRGDAVLEKLAELFK